MVAMRILLSVAAAHTLAIDMGGHARSQYQQFLDASPLIAQWWAEITRGQSFVVFSGSLSQRQVDRLHQLKADSDDFPYLGVAKRCDSRLLIHRDRGYDRDPDRLHYIQNVLQVRPIRYKDALAELSGPLSA